MQKNSAAAPILTPTSRVPVYSPALNAVFAGTGSLMEVTVAVCAPAALVTVMAYSMIASGIALGFTNRLIGSQTTELALATDNAADATTKVFCAFAVLLDTTICSLFATSTPASLTHADVVSGLMAVTSSCTIAVLPLAAVPGMSPTTNTVAEAPRARPVIEVAVSEAGS